MDGLNSLSVLDNGIQSLAQKVYTGKELDRVNAFYKEHCEIVEKELNVLQILKEKRVDLMLITDIMQSKTDREAKDYLPKYNKAVLGCEGMLLVLEEMTQIVEWLKEE